jgi:hypothetical protein
MFALRSTRGSSACGWRRTRDSASRWTHAHTHTLPWHTCDPSRVLELITPSHVVHGAIATHARTDANPRERMQVLGVARTATHAEIRKAYKQLALRLHPDKPGGDEEMFKLVSGAYEVRTNAHYEQRGLAGWQPEQHRTPPFTYFCSYPCRCGHHNHTHHVPCYWSTRIISICYVVSFWSGETRTFELC